jgi:hypothetical protein
VLALASPYSQHINPRRKPGQGGGKLMLHMLPFPAMILLRNMDARISSVANVSAGIVPTPMIC